MAIDDTPSSFFAPWPDRLRHSAIILLAAGLALTALVTLGELPLIPAAIVFALIAAAALVPWRLHDAAASPEMVRTEDPVETAAVNAVVAGMPDPAVLLDRAGRVIHLNAAAAQLAPALRKNELAQFALRSPEIVSALREAIATTQPRRATYLDQVPVDRWMELVITLVPVDVAHYVLSETSPLAFTVSGILGTAVATVFRFWAYRKYVFDLEPDLAERAALV